MRKTPLPQKRCSRNAAIIPTQLDCRRTGFKNCPMAEVIFVSDQYDLLFVQFSSESVILLIQNLMIRFYILFKGEFFDIHQQVVQLIRRRGA